MKKYKKSIKTKRNENMKVLMINGSPHAQGNTYTALQDAEGLQTMRTLAGNMAFLMKSIAPGKAEYGLPKQETKFSTNFIR